MRIFLLIIALITIPIVAFAQIFPNDKNCIKVTNASLYTISGDFVSDKYEKDSEWGKTMVSNRYKFKIKKNETQNICPSGPYFEGPSIEFVIRRAWPVFRCKALLGQDLTVTSKVNSDGGEKFSANCF